VLDGIDHESSGRRRRRSAPAQRGPSTYQQEYRGRSGNAGSLRVAYEWSNEKDERDGSKVHEPGRRSL
jgi:hypothetical protein